MKRESSALGKTNLRGVNLQDFNLKLFEDKELAKELAADCLKLFFESNEDFRVVRDQAWYKRLWNSLSGGNTKKLAMGCVNANEAQQLLLRVLQIHANLNTGSQALMVAVARGLNNLGLQQSVVARAIVGLAEKMEVLEGRLDLHERMIQSNPENENTWNQEHRLLLYKFMVIGAYVSQILEPEEYEVLDYKLESLELKDDYYKEAISYARSPYEIDGELAAVDSYKMRLTMLKHFVGILSSDGRMDPIELASVSRFATLMAIREEDKEKIIRIFSGLKGKKNIVDEVKKLLSSNPKRSIKAPDEEDIEEVKSKSKRIKQKEKENDEIIENALGNLNDNKIEWATNIGLNISQDCLQPINDYFEGTAPSDSTDIKEIVQSVDTSELLSQLKKSINEKCVAVTAMLEVSFSEFGLPKPVEIFTYLEKEFSNISFEVKQSIEPVSKEIKNTAYSIEEIEDSNPGFYSKCFAGGVALGFLGPLGILAGFGAGYVAGKERDEKSNRLLKELSDNINELGRTADDLFERIALQLKSFFLYWFDEMESMTLQTRNAEPVLNIIKAITSDESSLEEVD